MRTGGETLRRTPLNKHIIAAPRDYLYHGIVFGDLVLMAGYVNPVVAAVDDDFRVRESIESLLASAGFTPWIFTSAEEFLQSGTLDSAACLITDVRMPGMDGLELQRRVGRDRPGLPVIFMSAHYDDETRSRAMGQGASAFLYKPFDAADLLGAIEQALRE
jgi:FixJ family two-component response regulator